MEMNLVFGLASIFFKIPLSPYCGLSLDGLDGPLCKTFAGQHKALLTKTAINRIERVHEGGGAGL